MGKYIRKGRAPIVLPRSKFQQINDRFSLPSSPSKWRAGELRDIRDAAIQFGDKQLESKVTEAIERNRMLEKQRSR